MPKTNACKESVGPTVEKFTLASPSSARDLVDAMASSSAQAQCIVLVGGGHAHAQVIKALNAWARPARVRVVLIDPQVRSRTASWLFVHPRPRAPCRSAGERFPGAGGCSPIWHGVGGFTSHSLSSRSTRRSAPPPPGAEKPALWHGRLHPPPPRDDYLDGRLWFPCLALAGACQFGTRCGRSTTLRRRRRSTRAWCPAA